MMHHMILSKNNVSKMVTTQSLINEETLLKTQQEQRNNI